MSFICEFCNKVFSTQSNLSFHKKTAKFCLNIQNKTTDTTKDNTVEINSTIENNNSPLINTININSTNNNKTDDKNDKSCICSYCNKQFTIKAHLKTHYLSCKSKKEYEIEKDITQKYNENVNNLKLQYERKIQDLEHKIDLLNLELTKEKIYTSKVEEKLEEYKNRLFDRDDKIADEFIKRPTAVYNDNTQYINNYNIQYNKMFNDLTPLTDSYLKSKISEISAGSLIYVHNLDNANSNIIDYNFACNLVNVLKNNVFFTDIARGKLVYKDENENKMAIMAESFILDCIARSREECLNICKVAIDMVRDREQEFTDKDYGQCIMGLGQLSDCIKAGKPHAIITEIANKLCKNSKVLPSIKDFKQKQLKAIN